MILSDMDLVQFAHYAGAGLNVLLGLIALGFPRRVGERLGLTASGPLGVSEIRATYGGFFLGLGLFCLIFGRPVLFRMLGAGWLFIAVTRLVSMVIQRRLDRDFVLAFTVEMLVAWLLLLRG